MRSGFREEMLVLTEKDCSPALVMKRENWWKFGLLQDRILSKTSALRAPGVLLLICPGGIVKLFAKRAFLL